jgi:hypothetical protein
LVLRLLVSVDGWRLVLFIKWQNPRIVNTAKQTARSMWYSRFNVIIKHECYKLIVMLIDWMLLWIWICIEREKLVNENKVTAATSVTKTMSIIKLYEIDIVNISCMLVHHSCVVRISWFEIKNQLLIPVTEFISFEAIDFLDSYKDL